MVWQQQIAQHLADIYPAETAVFLETWLKKRLDDFRQTHPAPSTPIDPARRVSGADAVLITYGDQIREPGRPALQSLAEFLRTHLKGVINTIHILPFYPYTSDDGFSVIDYMAVDPALGTWDDVARLRPDFRLMVDAVINHISAQSPWFQGFLRDDPRYIDYFITASPTDDLSGVTRPRTHPLLTPFETPGGTRHVWTTFSADQLDLNYANPAVVQEIINVLLFYVAQGADFIRLDAIGYLWKEIGTSCLHLPQTHQMIQLFRAILDDVAPGVNLITETNVPHAENISYFGNGRNEAQLVYNFSLAPLILHTLHSGNAEAISRWAAGLTTPGEATTYFNFIASHDGIGVMPAKGILTDAEIEALSDKVLAHGGLVSHKTNPDGSQSVYELNITLFDALNDPTAAQPQSLQIDRFMGSQAIMLAMAGVPGIYAHSLFGSSNNLAGVQQTGRARTINRRKWNRADLESVLTDPASRESLVFNRYRQLLRVRATHPAFDPTGAQIIITANPSIFGLLRIAPDKTETVLCLHNVSSQPQSFTVTAASVGPVTAARELITDKIIALPPHATIQLAPYQVMWLALVK